MSTIDPGLGDPISQSAHDVEGYNSDDAAEQRKEDEEEEELRDPSRWWFASTMSPLLAGTLGPIASGFSVCALAWVWRVHIPPEGTEEHGKPINDPSWLIALNAVSLFFALVGNASLLLNMTQRLRFVVAQPITITSFLLAGVLLIADIAAINASPTYYLTGNSAPDARHALTPAYYYAIWAAALYMVIGFLMCFTVLGAHKKKYEKEFHLTPSQRTLMLQTMSFITYLLLGALVFSTIEGWRFVDAVYWADVTVLTVGFGDYSPATRVGRGLLFPFALGGILIVGLVVGSIRSLVLERGQEKISARITEKRRSEAINGLDKRKHTIKIGWLASAHFVPDVDSAAQRREQEFNIMRKVQDAAERQRRYMSLFSSAMLAITLWLVGAAIFMHTERTQQWTYFDSVYFTFVSLLTIGYGDYSPDSNAGRAFFVVWSLLAVPSLTILISNMGDTFVVWFSDATLWLGSITVLPDEHGVRVRARMILQTIVGSCREAARRFTLPGVCGAVPRKDSTATEKSISGREHEKLMTDRLIARLTSHIEAEELEEAEKAGNEVERDMHFYHYVLARECRALQSELSASPSKKYSWEEWEYFLKIVGDDADQEPFPGQKVPNQLIPTELQTSPSSGSDATVTDPTHNLAASQTDGLVSRRTELNEWKKSNERRRSLGSKSQRSTAMEMQDWSWLSAKSPLISTKSETEWILEKLSAALERELNRQRRGLKRAPPISVAEVVERGEKKTKKKAKSDGEKQC